MTDVGVKAAVTDGFGVWQAGDVARDIVGVWETLQLVGFIGVVGFGDLALSCCFLMKRSR